MKSTSAAANASIPETSLQLRSLITPEGALELSLRQLPTPALSGDSDVLVRVEASPLNPSDLGLILGGADIAQARVIDAPEGSGAGRRLVAPVSAEAMKVQAGRAGQSMSTGNEAAGTVVAAGSSAAAQALLGRRVAMMGGSMHAQYRALPASQCLLLPPSATAAQGASCFINPLTALGLVETMKQEGHTALVHTAAASNLGQMLVRICQKDGIGFVNVVRRPDQADVLRAMGAQHILDSSQPGFMAALTDAVAATGATIGFDAIGGGPQVGQILNAMESAIRRRPGYQFSRYGSRVHKQVYVYGGLSHAPMQIERGFGLAWGVGGWFLFEFLERIGEERVQQLKQRVHDELTTTFASHYTREVSFEDLLSPQVLLACSQLRTGEKALVCM